MAHHPQAPQGPQGNHDPAGSTQMFRAFVDEGGSEPARGTAPSGSRLGLIVGVIAALAVVAVAWLALS
ncbi:hypothetical protein JJV70_20715 [Streptomyces sp. JJ66]|uniref:hypothetical protein n=1 Tax=Streptomyces sp. JJ66 TaxID=2803843 RepID=UPI001C572A2F|nr:hypothetical protein [Streptomyces sp. JJ66]MBW1604481.1 hypothetical protein [Streptomyces sp. JJ66]